MEVTQFTPDEWSALLASEFWNGTRWVRYSEATKADHTAAIAYLRGRLPVEEVAR